VFRRRSPWISFVALVVLAATAACGGGSSASPHEAKKTRPSAPATTSSTAAKAPAVDPASVKANELGVIPVFMYHRFTPTPKGEYDRSLDDFRGEIQRLYDGGYRPILARDLITGHIDVPAGKTPVVLTFDDASVGQYHLDASGNIAPDTAIGFLVDFAKTHPDFTPVATMYVNGNPFEARDGTRELRDLVQRGFELGEHTLTHANLAKADPDTVQKELVQGLQVITKAVPDAKVTTMALPFGAHPQDPALAHAGTWQGQSYSFDGVFLVGSGPSPSPYASAFDPLNVPRIRSSAWDGKTPNYGTGFWLDSLEKHPERRYVSDGDPDHVSFPDSEKGKLAPALAAKARAY
jgi:peptidoglycan/xylan/chitin deacetylase (PgdA/CDA1 family)